MIEHNGKQLLVEIDGSSHFYSIQDHHPLGKTILKRKIIENSGLPYLSINHFDNYSDLK